MTEAELSPLMAQVLDAARGLHAEGIRVTSRTVLARIGPGPGRSRSSLGRALRVLVEAGLLDAPPRVPAPGTGGDSKHRYRPAAEGDLAPCADEVRAYRAAWRRICTRLEPSLAPEPGCLEVATLDPPRGRASPCMGWLGARLAAGPVRVGILRREAEAAGFSPGALYRARVRLPICQTGGRGDTCWSLGAVPAPAPSHPPPAPATPEGPRYAYPSRNGRFHSRTWHEGRILNFGTFDTEEEARANTLKMVIMLRGPMLKSPVQFGGDEVDG